MVPVGTPNTSSLFVTDLFHAAACSMHAARPTPPTPCRRAGCSLLWVRWPLLLHGAVFWHMNARIPRSHAAVCPVPSVICGSLTGTKPRTAHTSWGEGGCGGICSPDQGRGDRDC